MSGNLRSEESGRELGGVMKELETLMYPLSSRIRCVRAN